VRWCLAYTEPGAGSDLSCVASTATPVGDGFVLDGEKALVTGAHKAELCLTIARTSWSPPSREGLTMFVVDLASPGVTVRRRQTANGWTLGELVFDGVQLDAASVVGEVGAGWRQMAAALVDERSGAAHLGWATRLLDDLWEWAVTSARDDACEPIAALRADLAVGYRLAERVLARQDASEPAHVEAAMSKVWVTELLQRIARTGQDVVGVDALAWSPLFGENAPAVTLSGRLAYERIERIHPTISVGANELQRDTIARAALSLGAKR
jgi:alkylation response protein AidB-like acyl-CoA dehydrogenase